MMNLNQYPEAIAKLARKLHRLDVEIRTHRNLVERLTAEIEKTIATDLELRNDQQRKAKRLELLASPDYEEAADLLQDAIDRHRLTEINLQLLRDNFRVAMLETRQAIASAERELLIA